MEKTIRYFLLIMIITGTLFAYGCKPKELPATTNNDVPTIVETITTPDPIIRPEPVVTTTPEAVTVTPPAPKTTIPATPKPAPAPTPSPALGVRPNTMMDTMTGNSMPMMNMMLVYKNGTYTQPASYISPQGTDNFSITLTLDNDVVTALSMAVLASGDSRQYQDGVKNAAPGLIVGKKLSDVGAFGRISSASLTTAAFNKAIASIKSTAKN